MAQSLLDRSSAESEDPEKQPSGGHVSGVPENAGDYLSRQGADPVYDRSYYADNAGDYVNNHGTADSANDLSYKEATKPSGGVPGKAEAGEMNALGGQRVKDDPKQKGNIPFKEEDGEGSEGGKKPGFWTTKKKAAAAGGGLLGFLGGGSLLFSLLLPFKLLHIIDNVNRIFNAEVNHADQLIFQKIENQFLRLTIQGVKDNRCKSTLEPGCLGSIRGNNPLSKLYYTWEKARLNRTLAEKYGIVVAKKDGQLFMALNGREVMGNAQLEEVLSGKASVFDEKFGLEFAKIGKYQEYKDVVAAINIATENETLVTRMIDRFRLKRFVAKEYKLVRCVIACEIRTQIHENIQDAKKAAKAYFDKYVLKSTTQLNAQAMGCAIGDTAQICDDSLPKDKPAGAPPEETKLTGFVDGAQQVEASYLASDLAVAEPLSNVVAKDSQVATRGFAAVIVEDAVTKLFGEVAGKAAGQAVEKFIPVAGQVFLAAQIIHFADSSGPFLKHMSYAITAIAAVKLYMMYSSYVAEIKSGKADAAVTGSMTQGLSTNISGASTDRVDATLSPLYGTLLGAGRPNSNAYKCSDGNPVPQGQLVCSEEKLDKGNDLANAAHNIVNFIPGLAGLAGLINSINDVFGSLVSGAWNVWCTVQRIDTLGLVDPCQQMQDSMNKFLPQFLSWLASVVLSSPITSNMSGARTFDMIAAGADVASNKSCQAVMGCSKMTNQQVADVRNQQVAQDHADFNRLPLFARIFDLSTPYSLMSRVAVAMPASPILAVQDGFASILGNPLEPISNLFSSIFASTRAFAATQPISDPFGVIQYGYNTQDIPNDPSAYWDQNCQGDYSTPWYNSHKQDANTGEAVATTAQPCMLISTVASSAGAIYDPSLLPPDALTPDNATTGSGTPTIGDIIYLNYGNHLNEYGGSDCQRGTCGWEYGSCSQFSLTSVLNSYHMRAQLEPGKGNYYKVVDIENQSFDLGVWNGPGQPSGFHSNSNFPGGLAGAWKGEADHFHMHYEYHDGQSANSQFGLDYIINKANQGHPVIIGAPNHYMVLYKGDANSVYLLDNGFSLIDAQAQTSDSVHITQGHVTSDYGRSPSPLPLSRANFLSYWDGIEVILTP